MARPMTCPGCNGACDASFSDRVKVQGGRMAHADCVSSFNLKPVTARKSPWDKFIDSKTDAELAALSIAELRAEFAQK